MSSADPVDTTYVTYRAFITMIVSMIVAGAALFGYVISLHTAQSSEGRAAISKRLDGIETRTSERLSSMDHKLDKLVDRVTTK